MTYFPDMPTGGQFDGDEPLPDPTMIRDLLVDNDGLVYAATRYADAAPETWHVWQRDGTYLTASTNIRWLPELVAAALDKEA